VPVVPVVPVVVEKIVVKVGVKVGVMVNQPMQPIAVRSGGREYNYTY
jgi:hypothetical protein